MTARPPESALFWVAAATGCAVMIFGAHGLFTDAFGTRGADAVRWFVAAGLAHDLLWSPLVLVAGWVTTRLPWSARTPVQLGLASTVVLTAVTWPLVQGWGFRATNPSALPLDYGRNLAVVVTLIWCAVIVAVGVRARTRS